MIVIYMKKRSHRRFMVASLSFILRFYLFKVIEYLISE